MSLAVTFQRAASAEFIEASAWYETKQVGLDVEFIAEIDRCVSLASADLQCLSCHTLKLIFNQPF